jgi:hypothetical protein
MMLIKLFKILYKLIFWVLILLVLIFFVIYALAPIYDFAEPEPFSGDKFLNPYQNIDSSNWKKGNFQVQSRVWMGITNGRHNTNEAIQAIYRQLGYDIIVTSDYMRINTFGEGLLKYIPTYEHGYGWRKNHQVCLGASKVCWRDYPLYQSMSHKQHVLNFLRDQNEIVAIAHPELRGGYTFEDMKYLGNYDLIEAFNNVRFSIGHWDAALSNGHLVYLLANDDAHDVFNPEEVGMVFTMINASVLSKDAILKALKSGRSYAVRMSMRDGADFVEKATDHKNNPVLKSMKVIGDTLYVEMSERAGRIRFLRQGGQLIHRVFDTCCAAYTFAPGDSYVRVEAVFSNGSELYFNPVVRYDGKRVVQQPAPQVNNTKTWIQRGIALVIALIILLIVVKTNRRRANRKKSSARYGYYTSR